MKRIYLILIAAVAITFTSCSDRDMDTVKPDTGQGAPIINLPEGASQGKIMVKFKPEAASFLDAAVTLYRRCDDPFGNFGYGYNSTTNRYS